MNSKKRNQYQNIIEEPISVQGSRVQEHGLSNYPTIKINRLIKIKNLKKKYKKCIVQKLH